MHFLPASFMPTLLIQENLVTRTQLRELGINAHHIEKQIAEGHWQEILSRVIKLDSQELTRRQELIAAALHFDHLVLTGNAALELLGFGTSFDRRIDLIGPRGGRTEPALNTVIHTSRRQVERAKDFPPHTTIAYTVAHAMAWAYTCRQAHHIAYWAVQQGHLTIFEIGAVVWNNRRSQIMKKAIGRVLSLREGIDTVHEHLFLKACEEFGLPTPILKPEFELDDGILIHPDFGLMKGDRMLAVEIDGSQHHTEEGRRTDAYRMRALADVGVETYRISNREFDENRAATMKALKFAFERF